jgi:ubiquinone/menaquinone biosynthesis C-methylase UbiE
MTRNVGLRELLIGVEGLALLRHLYDGTDADAARRLVEIRQVLDGERFGVAEPTVEADARIGYAAWSDRYDEPGNPIIALEEPEMWALFEACPPGSALDVACGTGRHARRLVGLGHQTIGVDISPEMLARARAAVPTARFQEADLRDIPAEDEQFELVVCGLALAHVPDLTEAIRELARVLATDGHLIVSVLHPFQALLGWHAPFEDDLGQRRFIREHPHMHADYMEALTDAGLLPRRCVEPKLTPAETRAKRRAFRHLPEATLAAYVGLPAVLIWDATKK